MRIEEKAREYGKDFAPAAFRFDWEKVSEAARQAVLRQAEICAEKPYPMRRASDFLDFVRTGSRRADEDPYFFRRRKLCYAALARALGEQEATYGDDVINGIWCICEETSWVISAHNINAIPGAPRQADFPLPDPDQPYVDLFSAQTGMILTLVRRMMGESLNPAEKMLAARITREIRKRILDPFLQTDDFWWMGFRRKDLCNWTPWIVSNVMLCALSEPMEASERNRLMIRACGMLDRWLDCVPEDGGCDEGAGYWNMAGGALLDCLEMLEEATGGEVTFWQEEKIRNILMFPARAEIGGGYFLNFADCDVRPYLSGERIQTAGEKLGEPALIRLGARLRQDPAVELADVPHFIRMLKVLFHPAPGEDGAAGAGSDRRAAADGSARGTAGPGEIRGAAAFGGEEAAAGNTRDASAPGDVWLPDLQVRVVRRGGWTLAAKGGHNGESHNHNDVGSFMLYLDGAPEIVDAGNMTYTAQTFSERRYELWNTRSACHNLPLIGGIEQRAGSEFRARETACLPDGLSMELAQAYPPEAGLLSLRRRLELTEEGLRLEDEIRLGAPKEITWVFMTRKEPVREGNLLRTETWRMEIPEGFRTETEEIPVTDGRMARNWPGSLWRVRVTDPEGTAHRAVWSIRRG